jgi:hypothetical protein
MLHSSEVQLDKKTVSIEWNGPEPKGLVDTDGKPAELFTVESIADGMVCILPVSSHDSTNAPVLQDIVWVPLHYIRAISIVHR